MAVQALYYEEAHPQDVLVQWWLHQSGHRASIEEIEAAAASSKKLKVQPASTTRKGFSVMLQDPPSWFQGFDEDLVEQIPLDIHEEATMMVLAGGWPEPALANHDRFNIAAWLRSDPRLGPRLSLGRALALVNHMLGSHSVLGKRQGRLVPYFLSEEYEKQENARCYLPTSLREEEECVASWEDLATYLKILLEEHSGEMMSARLKTQVRQRFHLELSETALGHVSLGSLLDDPRLLEHFDVVKHAGSADLLRLRIAASEVKAPPDDRGHTAGQQVLALLKGQNAPLPSSPDKDLLQGLPACKIVRDMFFLAEGETQDVQDSYTEEV